MGVYPSGAPWTLWKVYMQSDSTWPCLSRDAQKGGSRRTRGWYRQLESGAEIRASMKLWTGLPRTRLN